MSTHSDIAASLRALYADVGGIQGVFAPKAADYAAARPGYPDDLYDRLGLFAGAVVADIGAGTGLFSRGFLERGCRVVAVEPNDAMRAEADAALGRYLAYRSVRGTAENTTLEPSSVDLVAAAQAFHWFDPAAARIECLRILKPSGSAVLVWNDRVKESPSQTAVEEIFDAYGGARRATLKDQGNCSQEALSIFFGGTHYETFAFFHEHRLDEKGLSSLLFSVSYMPLRGSEEGETVREWGARVFRTFAENGILTLAYRTEAIVGRPVAGP